MGSLLNESRPPVFCPGCTHDRISHALDTCFQNMGLKGNDIVMVSDIGCSGLFDTFFNTHAFHGLHGRALTYAAGMKLARPDLHVVVTMGDGGMGIGGAHFLSACRRNLDITLLVLNNFNFGMTGGQFSSTTPPEAQVGSGFLNRLEQPMDICCLARAAGATYVTRCSGLKSDLPAKIEKAIRHEGFSVMDIWGICTGRYTKRNRLTPQTIEEGLSKLAPEEGPVAENQRKEYGRHYRETARAMKEATLPKKMEKQCDPPQLDRQEVIILGSAGQRIQTAGELIGFAVLSAGLKSTQKNEYNITVLTGPSISELVLSFEEIDYTGTVNPTVVIALAQEGVARRKDLFGKLSKQALVLQVPGVDIPTTEAQVVLMDFKSQGIKKSDWALASLGTLARMGRVLNIEMLEAALKERFKGATLEGVRDVLAKVNI